MFKPNRNPYGSAAVGAKRNLTATRGGFNPRGSQPKPVMQRPAPDVRLNTQRPGGQPKQKGRGAFEIIMQLVKHLGESAPANRHGASQNPRRMF